MKVSASSGLLDNLVNERFSKVLENEKADSKESTKLEEFTNMFRTMVNSENKPIKLNADSLLKKFEMQEENNKGVVDINRDLAEFIEKEIEKQSENKTDVITQIEISKIFEMVSVKEEKVVSKIKELEVMEDIILDLKEILSSGKNEGVKNLVDLINKDIYKSDANYVGGTENIQLRNELNKLKDFYGAKEVNEQGFENKKYLNAFVQKLNLHNEDSEKK